MLGQPALVAGHRRGDPQREALLAEQGVAAVAGAEGPDLARLGVVDDVLVVLVAGPGDVFDALRPAACRPSARRGRTRRRCRARRAARLAHPGHDPHRDGDVGRVGQLHADVGDRRAERAHREGHDVHRAADHAALEEAVQRLAHLGRIAPVVGRAGVRLALGADEGAVFDPGDVGGVGEGEVGVGALGVGEALEGAGVDQGLGEAVVLLGRAVAPVDGVGLGQICDLPDPVEELCVRGRRVRPWSVWLIRGTLFIGPADIGHTSD